MRSRTGGNLAEMGTRWTIGRGCTSNPGGTSISAAGAISGISSTNGIGYLVGVFLPDGIPQSPPPEGLDFGHDYDFTMLARQCARPTSSATDERPRGLRNVSACPGTPRACT
jgi:hypothetical protein